MAHRRSMKILPDSTGRELLQHHHTRVEYNNVQGGNVFTPGDIVVGGTSNVVMVVSNNDTVESELWGILDEDFSSSNFTPGEQLAVGGTYYANAVDAGVDVFIAPAQLVSYDNPFNGQKVDALGSAHTRFTEGSPPFDAVGRALSSEFNIIGEYAFLYGVAGGYNEGLYTTAAGTASVTHDTAAGAMVQSVGSVSGDKSTGTSKARHYYSHGQSQFSYIVLQHGDAGKAGLRRRWGIFDENDGRFFQLDGLTLSVVIRSSASGSPVDSVVPQSDWNVDRMDGSVGVNNPSGLTLDPSKLNGWWIDTNHGILARFGVFSPDGGRIILHVFRGANSSILPATKSSVTPLRAEMENTSGTASSSESRWYYAAVGIEGKFDTASHEHNNYFAYSGAPKTIGVTELPLVSLRPKLTFFGVISRWICVPHELQIAATGTAGEQFIVRIAEDVGPTTPTWVSAGLTSALEKDTASTAISGYTPGLSNILYQGICEVGTPKAIDLSKYFTMIHKHLHTHPDGVTQMNYTVTAQAVGGTPGTIDVVASIAWHEIA